MVSAYCSLASKSLNDEQVPEEICLWNVIWQKNYFLFFFKMQAQPGGGDTSSIFKMKLFIASSLILGSLVIRSSSARNSKPGCWTPLPQFQANKTEGNERTKVKLRTGIIYSFLIQNNLVIKGGFWPTCAKLSLSLAMLVFEISFQWMVPYQISHLVQVIFCWQDPSRIIVTQLCTVLV